MDIIIFYQYDLVDILLTLSGFFSLSHAGLCPASVGDALGDVVGGLIGMNGSLSSKKICKKTGRVE